MVNTLCLFHGDSILLSPGTSVTGTEDRIAFDYFTLDQCTQAAGPLSPKGPWMKSDRPSNKMIGKNCIIAQSLAEHVDGR